MMNPDYGFYLKKVSNKIKFAITFIHVTHNFDETLMLADRIAIMKDGKILSSRNFHRNFQTTS